MTKEQDYAHDYYLKNRADILERVKLYQEKNPLKVKEIHKISYLRNRGHYLQKFSDWRQHELPKMRAAWRGNAPKTSGREAFALGTKAEQLAFTTILEREGFGDIVWLNNHHAPFDLLARKNGQQYSFDVTTAPYKSYTSNSIGNRVALDWLCAFTGLHHIILFVSADLMRYVLKEKRLGVKSVAVTKKDVKEAKWI